MRHNIDSMKLSDIGEFGFIERFAPHFSGLVAQGQTGIGDDCAIIPANEREDFVVTTDLLVEDVHFLRNAITPQELGHKALAVNLSDIAAMGARPVGTFLSIGIPANVEVEYLDGFMEGFLELSQKYDVPLLGGDTTRSPGKIVANVCVMGITDKGTGRLRSMAQTGDIICVTGMLGDSAGGLKSIMAQLPVTPEAITLQRRHHHPEPHINEGLWLAKQAGVHAMMDVSDGIASDLKHILKASEQGATIELNKLPLSAELLALCQKQQWDAPALAATGGEDYVLLFTAQSDTFDELSSSYQKKFNRPITPIGTITTDTPNIAWHRDGQPVILQGDGFNHFSK